MPAIRRSASADVKGKPLMGWLGLADQPLAALVPRVRRDSIVRRLESWVKPAHAAPAGIAISAALLLTEGDQECIGFTIHPTLPAAGADHVAELPQSDSLGKALRVGIEHLSGQLSSLDLPAMLREASALAERHFVQVALRRSEGAAARPVARVA